MSPKKNEILLDPKPTYSDMAEKAVIGVMLAQPETIEEVLEILSTDDFFVPGNQILFDCLKRMHQASMAIDFQTVHLWLVDKKKDRDVRSPGILAEVLNGFATHLNVGSYIRTVKEKSALRSLVSKCSKIVEDAQNNADDVHGVIDRAESSILSINSPGNGDEIWDAKASVSDFRKYLEEVEQGHHVPMLATGIKPLDAINGGFPCPGYVVIAAPPGGGKSAMMMTLNENWCSQGIGVGNFSLEMTNRKLIQRRVANRAKMDSRLMNNKLDAFHKARVEACLNDIEDTPFWVDATSNLNPSELRARTRKMVKAGAKVIILDYVQLLRGSSNADKRLDQLTEVSRTISNIQKELGILFIVLAQITREAQKDGNYKAYHLADCAGITNDARAILMLEPNTSKPEYANCHKSAIPTIGRLSKVSDGEDGDIHLIFNKVEQRIS